LIIPSVDRDEKGVFINLVVYLNINKIEVIFLIKISFLPEMGWFLIESHQKLLFVVLYSFEMKKQYSRSGIL